MAILSLNTTNASRTADLLQVQSSVGVLEGTGAAGFFADLLTGACGGELSVECGKTNIEMAVDPVPATEWSDTPESPIDTATTDLPPPDLLPVPEAESFATATSFELSGDVPSLESLTINAENGADAGDAPESNRAGDDLNEGEPPPGLLTAWVGLDPFDRSLESQPADEEAISETPPAAGSEPPVQSQTSLTTAPAAPERAERPAQQQGGKAGDESITPQEPAESLSVVSPPNANAEPEERATTPQLAEAPLTQTRVDSDGEPSSDPGPPRPGDVSSTNSVSHPASEPEPTPPATGADASVPADSSAATALSSAAMQASAAARQSAAARSPSRGTVGEPEDARMPGPLEPQGSELEGARSAGSDSEAEVATGSSAQAVISATFSGPESGDRRVVVGMNVAGVVPGARGTTGWEMRGTAAIPQREAALAAESAPTALTSGETFAATMAATATAIPLTGESVAADGAQPIVLPGAVPDPVQQLVQVAMTRMQIVRQVGQAEFELHLTPPDLGTLRVALRQTRRGLSVRVAADDARTQQLLETSRTEILTALEKGAGAVELSLDTQSERRGAHSERTREPRVSVQPGNRAPPASPIPAAPSQLSFLA